MANFSRRDLLAGAAGVGGAIVLGRQPTTGGGAIITESAPRDQAIRPVLGGTWLSPESIDKLGTLGVGVEYNADPAVITNRHVLDDGSGETPSEVEGRTVYQPTSDSPAIGTVAAASSIGGAGSSDWAVVAIADAADWSTHTLGFGSVGASVSPSAGERIVLDGARTGLLGGEVTRTSVDANFRGELYSGLIEYQVDANTNTDGNSGCLVATIDDSGVVHPVGLHTFGIDEYRFAIPWSDLPSGVALSSGGAEPVAPAAGASVEAAVFDRSGGDWWVWVRNLGDLAASPSVELRDPDSGAVLASQSVSIGALSHERLSLSPGVSRARLVAGQTDVVVQF